MKTVINVLTNWAAIFLGMAITFVLSPFVVHQLGDTRYGLWAVVGSLVGYLGLLDLGIRVGVTRFVARHEAHGDKDAATADVTARVTNEVQVKASSASRRTIFMRVSPLGFRSGL